MSLPVEERPARSTVSCRPVMTLNSVVLPAPFGPISPVIAPGLDVEVDVADGEVPAEADVGAADLEQRHVDACVPPDPRRIVRSARADRLVGQASAEAQRATGSPRRA